MTFNNDTVVEECEDAVDSIPNVQYNFVPIAQLANMESNTVVGKHAKEILKRFKEKY